MNKLSGFLVLGIFSVLLLSCSPKKGSETIPMDALFSAQIQGRTHGIISSRSVVRIILTQNLDAYAEGQELPEGLFEFSPKVSGKSLLVGGNLIEFHPDKPLKNGQGYSVDFHLDKLLSVPKELRVFSFSFEVVPLDFSFQKGRLILDDQNTEKMAYTGNILLSDPIEAELLKKSFKLEGAGVESELQLEPVGLDLFKYRVKNIPRKADSWEFTISWSGKGLGVDKKGSLVVEVPGYDQFSLLDVHVEQGEDQFIQLIFSEELDGAQPLTGLIRLLGTEQYRLQKKGNEVMLYPLVQLDGEWDLVVEKSVRSKSGKNLAEPGSFHLALAPLPPQVEFLGSGYVLPSAEGLYLPFRAVSLRAVDLYVYKVFSNNIQQFLQQSNPAADYSLRGNLKFVGRPVFRKTIRLDEDPGLNLSQWNTFSFDLGSLVQNDPHALYHVEIRIRKALASFVCEEAPDSRENALEMLPEAFSKSEMKGYTDDEYYYEDLYPESYSWRERENPCNPSYYTPDRFVYRNVLATNLGVLAKSGNQKDFLVAVTNLITAEPVPNATVEFYNFQQQLILSGATTSDGLIQLSLPEVPYLLVASSGAEKAYLRVNEGSSLSLSNFDLAGEKVEDGIKGFIYGERGVWRPGDTLHLSFLLFDKDQILPKSLPVSLEVFNARGQLAHKAIKTNGIGGFYTFPVPTDPDDPTGNWRALVQLGGISFEKSLKVENIKPNRLKMELTFNRETLRANDPGLKLEFRSEWLHGAPAAGMRAEVLLKLNEGISIFKGYEAYSFVDPLQKFWPSERVVYDDLLNQDGKTTIPLDLQVHESAPGLLNATFTSRVYEKGGEFSTDVYTLPFSPYDRYVGLAVSGLDRPDDPLATDTLHRVDVVTINSEGKPLSIPYLEARVYKLQWRWWWSSESDDLASYVGREQENLVYETHLATTNGKGNFSFRIDYPNWGRYLIHLSDPEGGHGSGQIVYLDWPAWVNRSGRTNPAGATMLTFSSDKKDYQTGDKAVLSFPSMPDARALLSLESGNRVLESRWIKTKEGETKVNIAITEEMAPNVYASITLIQSHLHEGNDLPIRQYGVLRLPVANPDSRLNPEVVLPEEIRPEEDYRVQVREKNGRSMTYTLAIVDQGLLGLTRYKTPDPWNHFYAIEALGVKTWDMYDDVLGAYGGRLESLLAIGGDEGALQEGAQKANRFKPVVTFMGPFELKKGRTDSHKIKMANYVGEVKAMVIAGKERAWGSAETTAPVRQPLMVLASLPRKLSLGEELSLPVSVFVMKEGLGDAEVSLNLEGPISSVGALSKNLRVSKLGEELIYFDLKTTDDPGIARIRVDVRSGSEKASYSAEIQVINPNPYLYHTQNSLLDPGKELEVKIDFKGMTGTNSGTLSVSSLPSFNLEKNLQYLINYPYGCVEQTTSSAFVQLYLNRLTDLSDTRAAQVDRNIREAIKRLASFQLPGGGLSFWPGSSGVSLWGSSYALNFLLMAEKEGYVIPSGLKTQLLSFQNNRANSYSGRSDYNGDSDLQQAYRLFTLALAGRANTGAMNRLRENTGLDQPAAWRLAAAYALAGRKQVAEELVTRYQLQNLKTYSQPGSSFGSLLRDRAMIVETMLLLENREAAFKLARELARDLQAQSWSTQSTAFGLMAMAQLSQSRKDAEFMKFTINKGAGNEQVNTQKALYQLDLTEKDQARTIRLINRDSGTLFVDLLTYGQALPGEAEPSMEGIKIEVKYSGLDGQLLDVEHLKQGTSFVADVWVGLSALNGQSGNLALSQVFPSGWEILSTRYVDQEGSTVESPYEYRDIRDDRVHTFFSLNAGQTAHFQIKLNAAYVGRFYLPPVTCEDMYRPEVHGNTGSQYSSVIR